MSFTFNNTVNGEGNNFAQGQTVTQNNTQSFDSNQIPVVTNVIQRIAEAAAVEQPEFAEEHSDLKAEFGTPQQMLQAVATEAEQELSSEPVTPEVFEQKKSTWMTRLQAVAPAVLSVGIAGGEALLSATPVSPAIAALLACVTAAKAFIHTPTN